MKSLDTRLEEHSVTGPRRLLSNSFTEDIMQKITTPQFGTKRGLFYMLRHMTKPVAAGIIVGGVTLVGGSSFAAMQWLAPNTSVRTNTVTTLPNGNQRFWIHSDSCQGQEQSGPVDGYYEIKAGAKMTPQKLAKGIETSCESIGLNSFFPQMARPGIQKGDDSYSPGSKQYFAPFATVDSVTKRHNDSQHASERSGL
jgi:hypothetical protein